MEFFSEGKAVRLRSHLGKYLFAADDDETVRQSRNASSHKVRWTVEIAEGHCHVIRLRSYNSGKYLSASDEPFLLGVTGRKVVLQADPTAAIDWEPIREGMFVMLRAKLGGKFLRANGGTPPWRNSVTHDVPNRTATQDWVLWEVVGVDAEEESVKGYMSPASSFNFNESEEYGEKSVECFDSPHSNYNVNNAIVKVGVGASVHPPKSVFDFGSDESGMEIFRNAKVVRLRSHHGKYLWADKENDGVCQDRNGNGKNSEWTVEIVQNAKAVRFKSCYGKYLTASSVPFLLGSTGKKVGQSVPKRLDSSVEWEPIKEGVQVKLMSRSGHYLRANGGLPPWRNSVTHDIPQRTATRGWILWDVYVLEK